MLHTSVFSHRRPQRSHHLSDARLDALARAWTPQDRARLKAQRTPTARLSRNRIWQRIQDEFAQWALTQPLIRVSD